MKASFVDQFGDSTVFKFGDLPTPEPQKNEVLVKLHAAALNHIDIWVRKGGPAYPVKPPHVMGSDGAGTVEKLGAEAEGVSEGDRVLILPGRSCGECFYCLSGRDNQCATYEIIGAKRWGTYAEYVAVPDDNVVVIPEGFSYEIAASFPLTYLTAWHMLIGRAALKPKEKVLIVGASSGVSVAAIQIAKSVGAMVFATTTSADKIEKIKALGADEVFLTEEGKDFSKHVLERTHGQGVEVALEHVGPVTWEQSFKSVARYGRLVTCGATTGPTVTLDLRLLFARDVSLLGARGGTKKEFQELSSQVFSGKLKPLIDKVFPLQDAAEAHRLMDAHQQIGKILLKII